MPSIETSHGKNIVLRIGTDSTWNILQKNITNLKKSTETSHSVNPGLAQDISRHLVLHATIHPYSRQALVFSPVTGTSPITPSTAKPQLKQTLMEKYGENIEQRFLRGPCKHVLKMGFDLKSHTSRGPPQRRQH